MNEYWQYTVTYFVYFKEELVTLSAWHIAFSLAKSIYDIMHAFTDLLNDNFIYLLEVKETVTLRFYIE